MAAERTTRQVKAEDCKIKVIAVPDHTPVRGNAIATGDEDEDTAVEDAIIKRRRTSVWAWASVTVTVTFKDRFSVSDHLGCCSYESRKDFIENSGYYDDMVDNCLIEINEVVSDILNWGAKPEPKKDERGMDSLANEAIIVQDACNLSGIVHAWSRSISRLRELLPNADTDQINRHAINILFASKVADLTRCEASMQYFTALNECKGLALNKPE